MNLILTVYTDDTLKEIKRVCEADRLKVPYRVAMTVAQSLDDIDLDNVEDKQILKMVAGNIEIIDKIIKATFGVTDTELECVDVSELGVLALELYRWGIEKISSIKGENEKN